MGPDSDNNMILQSAKDLRAGIVAILEQLKNMRDFSVLAKDLEDKSEVLRCLSLSITEMQSSRHWLGEVLGACGEEQRPE